jgi:hypothetical protein
VEETFALNMLTEFIPQKFIRTFLSSSLDMVFSYNVTEVELELHDTATFQALEIIILFSCSCPYPLRMAVTCGGVLCGVGIFIGFMILSDMLESSSESTDLSLKTTDLGNFVFSGSYKFFQEASGESLEGRCQVRGVSKSSGLAGVALTSFQLSFRQGEAVSELELRSGLLIETGVNAFEFAGKGTTHPFLFGLSKSSVSCGLDTVDLRFSRPSEEQQMVASGLLSSSTCGFKLELSVTQIDLNHLKRKIVNYSILTNALTLCLIKLYIDQIRILDSSSNFARFALASVVMQSIADSLESIVNFFLGLSVQFLFNIFIIIALFKFILFSFFEMRVIIFAWRQLYANQVNGLDAYDAARLERTWIQTRMYLPMIFCLVCLIMYPDVSGLPLMLVSQLFWVPQIVQDAIKGHKSPLSNRFIIGVSVCRSLLPIYVWGCPRSIFGGELLPRPPGGAGVAVTVAILQIIQASLLLTQKKFGPRWFVPWMCLPHVYNYYRKIDLVDEEFGVPECVVCMSEIELKPVDKKSTVITPCGHLFHTQCLAEWMNLRQECPLCRRELPPIT